MIKAPPPRGSSWATASSVMVLCAPPCALASFRGALAWRPLGNEDPDLIAAGIGLVAWGAIALAGLVMGILSIRTQEPRRVLARIAIGVHSLALAGFMVLAVVGVR